MFQFLFVIGFFAILATATLWMGRFVWRCLRVWTQIRAAGGKASLPDVVQLEFQRLPVQLVADAYTALVRQGVDVSLEDVKAELIFGGEDIEDASDLAKAVLKSQQRAQDEISPSSRGTS